ncbi:MAG: amidohydrolase family protein, partial [Pseudomonadota bacterium]
MRKTLLAVFSAWTAIGTASADATLIHAGKLLAVPGEGYLSEQTVRIENGVIMSVEAGYVSGRSGDVVIDLREGFVLPGLIDSHVHITSENGPDARLRTLTDSEVDAALLACRT